MEGKGILNLNILKSYKSFDFSPRLFNCIEKGISDGRLPEDARLCDIASIEISDFIKFRDLGKKSLTEMQNCFISNNITFGLNFDNDAFTTKKCIIIV